MKLKILKFGISSILFIATIFLALVLIRPSINKLEQSLTNYRDSLLLKIEDKTGLQISYKSISPSILSAFNIKGIVLCDVNTELPILQIKKASLSYNLKDLIKGDFSKAFNKLIINGITVEYDSIVNNNLLEKLSMLSTKTSSTSNNAESKDSKKLEDIVKDVLFTLPFGIEFRDINLHYQDKMLNAVASLSDVILEKDISGLLLDASIDGKVDVSLLPPLQKKLTASFGDGLNHISGNFYAAITLSSDLNGSMGRIRFSSVKSELFSMSNISFLTQYMDGVIHGASIQERMPFSVKAEYDTKSQFLALKAEMDKFDPFSLVTINKENELIDKIKGSTISGNYSFELDSQKSTIHYAGNGSLDVSSGLIPAGANVAFDITGNSRDIVVSNLSVHSEIADASLEGSYNFSKMSLSGLAFLERFVTPSGGTISGEMFIDPLDSGFVCFIPQLYFNDKSFTALQLTMIPDLKTKSFDFDFEMSDYSHIDYGTPGIISVAGSLMGGENLFVQAQISVNDFFVDSIIETIAFFTPNNKKSLQGLSSVFDTTMMTNEFYVSTDFSSVSFNVPYWIIADTAQDNGIVVISFTGNENNLNISQFDFLYGTNSIQFIADVGIDYEFKSAFFTADATVNSIPYSLNGSFMPETGLNIKGSYGLSVLISFLQSSQGISVDGLFNFQDFPIAFGNTVITCTADLSSHVPLYDIASCFVDIRLLSVSEASGLIPFEPSLSLSGKINNYGLTLDNIIYNDLVSLLDGSGNLMWSFSDSIFESASLNLSLTSTTTSESYLVSASLSNPDKKTLSSLVNDFYFSSQISINEFPMARVRLMQSELDVCSADIMIMGTIENPYVSLNVKPSRLSFSGVPFYFNAGASLDDGVFYLNDSQILFGNHKVSNISGQFSLSNFVGKVNGVYDGSLSSEYNIHAPIELAISSSITTEEKGFTGLKNALAKGIPEYVIAELDAMLTGSLFDENQSISLDIERYPGYIKLSSDENLGIAGTLTNEGNISVKLDGRMPLHAEIQGFINQQQMNINAMNIYSDLSAFEHLLYFPYVALHGGLLRGNASLGGILADPEFSGDFIVQNLAISCPDYVPEHIVGANVPITLRENEIKIDNYLFDVDEGNVNLDLTLTMDRWKLDLLSLKIKTPKDTFIPALINIPPVTIDGMSTCDLNINITMSSCDIVGKFYAQNVDIKLFENNMIVPNSSKENTMKFTLDIDVTTGQHVEIKINPLLRGLIEPGTNLKLKSDSIANEFKIKSDVKLRGGEVTYLNRNFYLREGRIILDEDGETFDPRLTVRAEIRERDENGEPVRIIMSAENQRLSEFNPSYISSPARSELEIMTMLGQAAAGDIQDGWDVLLTGVDYGFQVFVLGKIENALRDLLNSDIFSLRTMGLQNSLRQFLNNRNESKPLTISNFLDNTTVYIGKYFGSSIYADALFHFAYDETKIASGESVSGLMFQPEIGLEMDSPFATIRWTLAPEIGTTQHLWVPATSITLSWKFVF